MGKVKNLIFILVMLITLSSLGLAYSVGEVVEVEVYGYTKGPNGTLSATGVNCIPGKTAAVSWDGKATPDLKYGTIVYLESTNKSYVICDIGTEPKYTSLAIEPFCSTVSECYAITRNKYSNGNTKIKILHIPTGNNIKQNVLDSLELLPNYSKVNIYGNSPTTQFNKCTVCGGIIGVKWYKTLDGTHYKACTQNHDHQYNIEEHNYKDGKCVCGAIKCSESCDGAIGEIWYKSAKGTHYKTCTKNSSHHHNIESHVLVNGVCTVCLLEVENTLFSDLPDNHWAYEDVKTLQQVSIVKGRGDGTLGANDKVTAEEFLSLLSRVISKKGLAKGNGISYLENEMQNSWSYNEYIELTKVLGAKSGETVNLGAKEIKLILGNTESKVLENYKKPITREQAANIMGVFVTAENETSVNILNAKDWGSVNPIYKKRINKLVEKEIFRGVVYNDGSIEINPTGEISRVEAISLISRLYNTL